MVYKEEIEEYREREAKFENDFILYHRPDAVEQWLRDKQEVKEQGFDEIMNMTPEDWEEYQRAEQMFNRAESLTLDLNRVEPVTDFHGIATDLLGDEDGG